LKEVRNLIEVKNLVKRYGDHTAVDHLSFEIEKGKIYGFLGPNGAGKSTTMNMITGYIASTEGTVVIDGHAADVHANLVRFDGGEYLFFAFQRVVDL
jgi:ABC-2 type transport system ATP-binding protein